MLSKSMSERARHEVLERLEPELAHPVGLVLVLGDRGDELGRETPAGLEEVVLDLVEAVLVVAANAGDDFGLRSGCHWSCRLRRSPRTPPPRAGGRAPDRLPPRYARPRTRARSQ